MEIIKVRKNNERDSFDNVFSDGRLCVEPSGKLYRLREAIALSEKLGRPLTEKEYEQFRI